MSCTYFSKKNGSNYCTAKGGYISFYCGSDDESCGYYRSTEPDPDCPYWSSGNYCSAKGGYVSGGGCNYGYTSCRYYMRNSGDDEDQGGCIISTACVVAKNLPDDCEELQILRNYRDTYLNSFELGRMDVNTYYSLAPIVVKAIRKSDFASKVFEDIYTNLVCKTVSLVNDGKYEEAHYYYKNFVIELWENFVK